MIRVEYDKESHTLTMHLKGDSTLLLFELNVLIKELLESFYQHDQELLVLEEIEDVVSEFAEKTYIKIKRRRRK